MYNHDTIPGNIVKYIIIMLCIRKTYGILFLIVNLNQLRIFYESARELNFSRAAERLYITQPAVSSQIKQLETALKAKLFTRIGRKTYLTETGKVLFEYSEKIFSLETEMERQIQDMKNLKRGVLHVGTTKTYARYLMPAYISNFHARYPEVSISLNEGSSWEMIQSLFALQNELAIVASTNYPTTLIGVTFRKEEVLLLAAPFHELGHKVSITVHELAAIPLIMREEGSGTRRVVMDMFQGHGLTPTILYEASNLEFIKELLVKGEGVSFIVRSAVEKEIKEGVLRDIPIEGVKLAMDANILFLKEQGLSKAALSFLGLLGGSSGLAADGDANREGETGNAQ